LGLKIENFKFQKGKGQQWQKLHEKKSGEGRSGGASVRHRSIVLAGVSVHAGKSHAQTGSQFNRRYAADWPLAKVSERTLRAKSFINAVGHYFA